MRMTIDVAMQYSFAFANTVALVLEAARLPDQYVRGDVIDLGDALVSRIAGEHGMGERIWAQLAGPEMVLRYHADVEVTRSQSQLDAMLAAPLHAIPAGVAEFLRPSRYCPADKFNGFVAHRFGHLLGGCQVAAMCDWIAAELRYVPGASNADTDALDTFASRQGVCRDYVHLFCALVRAAGIPARATAAYGPQVSPQDFHVVAEVWLNGAWQVVDPTGMCRPEETVLIATGRDACDIAFLQAGAQASLIRQSVQVSRA